MDTQRHSRRSKSFSFSDTISDTSDDSSVTITTPTPSTPLGYLGIPFSWEQVPGIPKKNTHKKRDSSQSLLPLPPSGNGTYSSPNMKKYSGSKSFKKDPFFAALVECSKDKEFDNPKGFVVSIYTSCKRSCSVSESIVYRRRSDYV